MTEKTESEGRLSSLPVEWLKSLPTPIFVLDEKGRIMWCNDTFVELTGYDRDGLTGARLDSLFGQRQVAEIVDDLLHLYQGRRYSGREYDLLRQSGSEAHVVMDLTPVFGSGGESELVSRVVGVIRAFSPVEEPSRK